MKRLAPRATSNKVFFGVVAALTLCSLALLLRLLMDFEQRQERRLTDLQRVFSDPALLRPEQPVFSFSEIESTIAKYRNQGDIGEMTLARRVNGEDHIVYPYFVPALGRQETTVDAINVDFQNPLPWKKEPRVRVLPLINAGKQVGSLLVRVNTSSLWVVRSAVASLVALLMASAWLFLMQFRRQEITITRTTVELEQKRRELVRLERLALAGQISANIFHDLKKPVLNIKNEADELVGPPGDVSLGSRIRQQVDLFFGILRDTSLERFVRAGDEREYVDINEMLDRSLALVKYERGNVEVRTEYTFGLPAVFAEPVRLIQVFSNIILNAYQALGSKGTLTLRTRASDSQIAVELEDNGPGILGDQLASIFEPFFTTKSPGEGTGLGLYISRDIIDQAGGSISVSSTPGRTCFTITLPANVEG